MSSIQINFSSQSQELHLWYYKCVRLDINNCWDCYNCSTGYPGNGNILAARLCPSDMALFPTLSRCQPSRMCPQHIHIEENYVGERCLL